jgi:tRNA G18 (ribose-2'-O)-methylase SpoU
MASNNPQYTIEVIISTQPKNHQWNYPQWMVKPSILSHLVGHNRCSTIALVRLNQENIESENNQKPLDDNKNLTVVLDNILDYGNMGSIVRNSFLMGVHRFLIINPLNIFNGKTIDSSRGLIFFCQLQVVPHGQDAVEYINYKNLYPLVTSFQGIPLNQWKPKDPITPEKIALILGNETQGTSDVWLLDDHSAITIEQNIHPQCDSMNVSGAASILVYYLINILSI